MYFVRRRCNVERNKHVDCIEAHWTTQKPPFSQNILNVVEILVQRGSFLSISNNSIRRWCKNQLEGVKISKTRLYISLHSRDSSVAVALPCWTFICVGSCYIRRACGNTGIRGRGIALYRSYVSPTHRYPPSRWPYSFRGKQSIRKRSTILRRSAVPRMLMRQQHREVALETPFFFFLSLSLSPQRTYALKQETGLRIDSHAVFLLAVTSSTGEPLSRSLCAIRK